MFTEEAGLCCKLCRSLTMAAIADPWLINLSFMLSSNDFGILKSPSYKRIYGMLSGLSATYVGRLFSRLFSSMKVTSTKISSISLTVRISPPRRSGTFGSFSVKLAFFHILNQLFLSVRYNYWIIEVYQCTFQNFLW